MMGKVSRFAGLLTLLFSTTAAGAATRYVSTGGNDANPGTSGQPYATIQKCATVSAAGDICSIGGGTYRETVTPNSGVSFQPTSSTAVVLDASDPVSGWANYAPNIYRAAISPTGLVDNQVFSNGVMGQEARFPNTGADLVRPNWGIMASGTTSTLIVDPNLQNIDWTGALVHWWAGSNPYGHLTATVTSSVAGQIGFTNPWPSRCPALCPKTGGKYYVVGKLAALDAEGEWFIDGTNYLYFWAPGGGTPTGVTIKRRLWTFDLRGKSNVRITNIKTFGGGIITDSLSTGNTIDGLNARYLSHFKKLDDANADYIKTGAEITGIVLRGSGNAIKNSDLQFSAGSGIVLDGTNNSAINNLISDMGYSGSYATAVFMPTRGTFHTVKNNTIRNTGRDGITISGYNASPDKTFTDSDISYNQIYNYSATSLDGGAIDACCQTDGSRTKIHHNWLHDSEAPTGGAYRSAGVYIDNSSANFDIYQNVSWNNRTAGFYLHGNGSTSKGNLVHDNTALPDGQTFGIDIRNVTDATGTRIENNRITGSINLTGTASNIVVSNNGPNVAGATEGISAATGCNFSGCQGPLPPGVGAGVSAFSRFEGESANGSSGTNIYNVTAAGSIDNGDWLRFDNIDLSGATGVRMNVAVPAGSTGQKLLVRVGSAAGTQIGSLTVSPTGGYSTFATQSTGISTTSGLQNVYIVGSGSYGIANLDWLQFTRLSTNLIEAEQFSDKNNASSYGTYMGGLYNGSWIKYNAIDFGSGVNFFDGKVAVAAAQAGQTLQIRLDSPTGTLVGSLVVQSTGSFTTFVTQSAALTGANGVHDVYLVAVGSAGICNIDSFQFRI